jgi:hypothetical protein
LGNSTDPSRRHRHWPLRSHPALIAGDPESIPDNSPTLDKTDRGSWVVQGWIVTDLEALAALYMPEGETVVEIPDRMIQFFK